MVQRLAPSDFGLPLITLFLVLGISWHYLISVQNPCWLMIRMISSGIILRTLYLLGIIIPSSKRLHSYWTWPSRNSWFTHCFNGGSFHSSLDVYQRVMIVALAHHNTSQISTDWVPLDPSAPTISWKNAACEAAPGAHFARSSWLGLRLWLAPGAAVRWWFTRW